MMQASALLAEDSHVCGFPKGKPNPFKAHTHTHTHTHNFFVVQFTLSLSLDIVYIQHRCSIGCPNCTGIGSHSAVSLCGGSMQPTLPKYAWTMNRWAVEGSVNDSYRFNPWRAPGSAPVNDACGMAGGTTPNHAGPGDAVFAPTEFAKMGDLGSKVLQPAPSGTVWTIGDEVEVSWGIRYNHGGGYQYVHSHVL